MLSDTAGRTITNCRSCGTSTWSHPDLDVTPLCEECLEAGVSLCECERCGARDVELVSVHDEESDAWHDLCPCCSGVVTGGAPCGTCQTCRHLAAHAPAVAHATDTDLLALCPF